MQVFTDLVGTTVAPAHCFNVDELTALTPTLDTAAAVHDMTAQASEAARSQIGTCYLCSMDMAAAVHDVATQASEAAPTLYPGPCAFD